MTATSSTEHEFSQVENILNSEAKYHYAIANKDYVSAGASYRYFRPAQGSNALTTGYISSKTADASGNFSEGNPIVSIHLESAYKSYGLTVNFFGNHPLKMKIHAYSGDRLIETYETDVTENMFTTDHEFPEFNRLDLEITKGAPYNNVYIDSVTFGNVTDYKLSYSNELTDTPDGVQTEIVKEIRQNLTILSETAEEAKELYKETLSVMMKEEITINLSNPSYGYSATIGGMAATVVESGAYYVVIMPSPLVSGVKEVILKGKEYAQSSKTYLYPLNKNGRTAEYENPLISTEKLAQEVSEWEGDYLYANREYDLQYRGDPRIDANDIVFLENKFVPNMLIRIYEHEVDFNGGALSGTIAARRDMYVDNAQDRLAKQRLLQLVRL